MIKGPIYFDFASSTPVNEQVYEAMAPYFLSYFGNASSSTHMQGELASKAVVNAKSQISKLVNCKEDEVFFTSGSTESIKLAISQVFYNSLGTGNHIVTSKAEHKAVLDTCKDLEKIGAQVTYLDVDENGKIDMQALEQSIGKNTVLVVLMHVNNETGVVTDIRDIGTLCKKKNILFFTDATQSYGKLPLNFQEEHIDILCFNAHKIYGPKGIGGLLIKSTAKTKSGIMVKQLIESVNLGTQNVPGIVGLGKSSELAMSEMKTNYERIQKLNTRFQQELHQLELGKVNAVSATKSPYILNVQLLHQDAESFILKNKNLISVSMGSACNSRIIEESHVLKSMGLSKEIADRSIRISFGATTTQAQLDTLIYTIKNGNN
ncbi:cysteine desulfurase family protein [Winogradskyella sp. SYSU M77433]|uniref:cysteine desulfurase family protein n=1 Tax=Winogradskyella sp. SYSU M77433 TaxID=3042722 RepID=UPI0024808ACE|nr:cysteine desulfurase family protein [Winogradskyella sp. SYSU M77433]MDH7911997.1 cysteine desulfurase family protein [Winogradskyella sp. SYSU M77433]